ncbi:MAG TPA: hypothetical protein PLP05_12570 [Sedimentisphaerales bacterium]|nr:hypothetical protein [Sedimentisphaerales bacterium]
MASTSETGHAINVANFESVIADVISYGATYNPLKASLKLAALNIYLTAARDAINAVNAAEPALKLASGARNAAFKPLSSLATKVINALKASDTTDQIDETAKILVRKIQGRRATPKKTEEQKKIASEAGKEIIEISSSQMSFDSRIDNFYKLIKLLSTVTLYAPNEADLKISALTTVLTDLKAKNLAVTSAKVSLSNARISRNDILYKENTGLVDTALAVKIYIKSVYGATSPQYKKISKIKFTKPR